MASYEVRWKPSAVKELGRSLLRPAPEYWRP
jgi:hypothetical protein